MTITGNGAGRGVGGGGGRGLIVLDPTRSAQVSCSGLLSVGPSPARRVTLGSDQSLRVKIDVCVSNSRVWKSPGRTGAPPCVRVCPAGLAGNARLPYCVSAHAPACYVCVYVNMHECAHTVMRANICCAARSPVLQV